MHNYLTAKARRSEDKRTREACNHLTATGATVATIPAMPWRPWRSWRFIFTMPAALDFFATSHLRGKKSKERCYG